MRNRSSGVRHRSGARRPYVICHMLPSIDGRIVTARWKLTPAIYADYDLTAETFNADAWMAGRISIEPYAGNGRVPRRKRPFRLPRTDYIARRDADSYAIALDPSGKLNWTSSSIDEDHVITVLSEKVSDEYLAFLRASGVSYLFGGKSPLDLKTVLHKLRRFFGIERLLLEGGGTINGSFLSADLIDELSLLVAPLADGSVGTPSLIDAQKGIRAPRRLKLISFEKRAGDLLWIRYRVKH